MSDNLIAASEPPPAKLSRSGDFDRCASRMENYLRGIDAKSHSSVIFAQLDDDVYSLARAAGVSSTMTSTEILQKLRQLLCGTTPSWLEWSEFRRQTQEPLEGVLESRQALHLLGRRAFPSMPTAELKQMLLEQFITGVSDPEVHRALPSTLPFVFLSRRRRSRLCVLPVLGTYLELRLCARSPRLMPAPKLPGVSAPVNLFPHGRTAGADNRPNGPNTRRPTGRWRTVLDTKPPTSMADSQADGILLFIWFYLFSCRIHHHNSFCTNKFRFPN